MINVHIVQVSTSEPEEMARLRRDVAEGYTADCWQIGKEAKAGDLVIWYATGRPEVGGQAYTAWGYAGRDADGGSVPSARANGVRRCLGLTLR